MNFEHVWKDIPGYEGFYQASNHGEVRRVDRGYHTDALLAINYLPNGYRQVGLSLDAKHKTWLIHRLVYLTFNGAIPAGYDVNHKNGIRWDNTPDNLECCTHQENMHHARHVLKSWDKPKKRNYSSGPKLNPDTVREIRRLVASGEMTQGRLAVLHKVEESTISRIVNWESWKDVLP